MIDPPPVVVTSKPKKSILRLFLKCLLWLGVILVVLIAALLLSFNTIAQKVMEDQVRRQTGLKTTIGRLEISWRHSRISIKDFALDNPKGFGGGAMIKLPELTVEYDAEAGRSNVFRCRLIRFDLAEVNIVENSAGKKNLEAVQKEIDAARLATSRHRHHTNAEIDFEGTDRLVISLGKITYRKLTAEGTVAGKVMELPINLKQQEFPNVRSLDDLDGVLFVLLLRSSVNFQENVGGNHNWLQLLGPIFGPTL